MGTRNTLQAVALVAALAAAPAAAGQHEMGEPEASGTAEMEKPVTAETEAPARLGTVARAQFTSAVIDREPTDTVRQVSNDQQTVHFFTELRNFQGQELVHRWEHAGEIKAEVPFGVAGPRWRVYSSKALEASWLGKWTVSVVDAEGNVAASESFEYVEATPPIASENPPVPTQPGPASQREPDAMDQGDPALDLR